MGLKLLAGPAAEPVTLAEAKLYARVDESAEDSAIALMITAARELFERETGLVLIRQSWRISLDQWPLRGADGLRRIYFPLRPLLDVTGVNASVSGAPSDVPSADYVLDTASSRPRLVEAAPGLWPKTDAPAAGIAIEFDAGFGDLETDVPAAIRLAILKLVAEAYEGRGLTDVNAPERLTPRVGEILLPYREARL